MEDDAAAVREELVHLRLVLEERLGRPSRWSGILELTDDPAVHGAKPFRCDILLNAALVVQDVRWRTLIHEMLHTFSAGYHRQDYDQSPGWEEGVVEQTQRLLRPAILARLGVTVEDIAFEQAEVDHPYNGYIRALEALRQPLNLPPEQFYLDLLSEPIKTRASLVAGMAQLLPEDRGRGFLRAVAATHTILKEKPE